MKSGIEKVGQSCTQYNFESFKRVDENGNICTNDKIESLKINLSEVYSKLPAFTSYTKKEVDDWVKNCAGADVEKYTINDSTFLAVFVIESGFFIRHRIVLKAVEFTNAGRVNIEFSVVDADGQPVLKFEAFEAMIQNIVTLNLYEQLLLDETLNELEARNG